MKETSLQNQKNQLIMQQQQLIQVLEQKVKIEKEKNLNQQQIIDAQKKYINELEKSQKQQNDYQELMRRENFLMSKKLNDMKKKLVERDKMIKLYQEELNREISFKELNDSLEKLREKLETHFKNLLVNSHLQPLIQKEVQKSLQSYMNALEQLESIDWSTLQDDELSAEEFLKAIKKENKKYSL